MCGRSRCALAPEQVINAAGTSNWVYQDQYSPSYNITPGHSTPVIRRDRDSGQPKLQTMRWGLVPSFTKPDDKPDFWRMFNARSESVSEKPSFRRLVPTKRCIVLLEGFYEWKKEGKESKKQPYYIYLAGGEPMPMAGLYDTWHGPDGSIMYSYTILTTDSGKRLEWLHDRMPVILRSKEAQQLWLDTGDASNIHKLHSILAPYDGEDLQWHAVTKEMSKPSFQGPECSVELKKPSVASFFKPKKPASSIVQKNEDDAGKKIEEEVEQEEVELEVKEERKADAEEEENEKRVPVPTPNTDEKPSEEEKKQGVDSPAGKKRAPGASPLSSAATPPSKKKARPPDQPDISSFFTKRK